jgi:Flp pilus assembly protein TadB
MGADILGISLAVAMLVGVGAYASFAETIRRHPSPGGGTTRRSLDQQVVKGLRGVSPPKWVRDRWATVGTQDRLKHAGLAWEANDFAALRWASLWFAATAAIALGMGRKWDLFGMFLSALIVSAGWFGPMAWLASRLDKRQMDVDLSLPDFMDRMALALEAGLGFEVALRRTSSGYPGLLGDELQRTIRQLDRGLSRSSALVELGNRLPSQDLKAFVAAVRQADRLGTSLAKTLRVQTGLLRARRRRRAQEASRRLPILIIFPLVFFFLPALLIIYLAPPLLHLFLGR